MILYPPRPSKYVKYTTTMTYGSCHTPFLDSFVHHLLFLLLLYNSVELAYRKSGTSTVLVFYMKRLLSLACVILDQENLGNFTHNCIIANFPYLSEAIFCVVTCIAFHRKVGLGSSARRSAGVEACGARANTSK